MQLINIQSQLEEFNTEDIQLKVLNTIKSGKEASVYRVQDQTDKIMALKVYKNHELRAFKQNTEYLAGMYIGSRSMRQAVKKKTKMGRDFVQATWVTQEYEVLSELNDIGADVPRVYGHASNSLLFEYIGDDSPAPRLAEIRLNNDQAINAFAKVLENIELFLQAGFIHGDLSAFNILYWQEEIYIIDFPQAIDILKNNNSRAMLGRDLENICGHFQRYFPVDMTEIHRRFSQFDELLPHM